MSAPLTTLGLLTAVSEPTRLRIVNCLSAAPLFVSELQAILDVPQPTVSRHLKVLRDAGLVRDTPVAQFVLYRLRRPAEPLGRLLSALLDAGQQEAELRQERQDALQRSRREARSRVSTNLEEHPA
jgi:ArsR family transcriptional regulator